MSSELYSCNCVKCHEITNHSIYNVRPSKGVKLQCMKCGHVRMHYMKADKLVEVNNSKVEGAGSKGSSGIPSIHKLNKLGGTQYGDNL